MAMVLALNTATAALTQAAYGIGGCLVWQALGWVSGPGEEPFPEISIMEKLN